MKKSILTITFGLALFMTNCSGSENTDSNSSENNTACGTNKLEVLKYDDAEQSFDQKYVYANYNEMYQSYRVIYLNYDKSEDSDYGQRTGDQIKVVIGLFSPAGDEFKPGQYTFNGDEEGFNRIAISIETGDGLKSINTAGIEDPGYVEIKEISKTHICGTFHLNGVGSELKGSFNTQHEKVN